MISRRGELLRRGGIFTHHTNAHLDGAILRRTVINQHPDSATRNFILNARRDKERVSQQSIYRQSLQGDPYPTIRPKTVFHRFPGKRRAR